MDWTYFVLATGMLLIGHLIRVLRWEQFIEVYEKPRVRVLLRAVAGGFFMNFFMLFHIGDFFRIIYAGRKMKNGVAFSLATVIVERYLDILAVGLIFIAAIASGMVVSASWRGAAMTYAGVSVVLFFLSVVLIKYSYWPKRVLWYMAGIFNESIRLKLLLASWSAVSSFKDMYKTLNRWKLLFLTLAMWGAYLSGYTLLVYSVHLGGANVKLEEVFYSVFATGMLEKSSFNIGIISLELLAGFTCVPLVALAVLSWLPKKAGRIYDQIYQEPDNYLNILPQMREEDQLSFLDLYFAHNNRQYVSLYLRINRDISIIRDYSAGSNATTMLCTDGEHTFFRKYAFGADGDKLEEQIEWLEAHQQQLPLPAIMQKGYEDGYCFYDMPYDSSAVSLFDYVHSVPTEKAWHLLEKVLVCLDEKLYHPTASKPENQSLLDRYLDSKVMKNLDIITGAEVLRKLTAYDEIVINGQSYHNLSYYARFLTKEYLRKVFAEDTYADIHGDMTIENIICCHKNMAEDDFYIIDPNTGNLHNSPYLDYGKLLQSLHGSYEFMMKTRHVHVDGNRINFQYTKSQAYANLLKHYMDFLQQRYGRVGLRSILYHEIVHWLRLLPYKIRKDTDRAPMFYAGLLMLLKDICEEYDT